MFGLGFGSNDSYRRRNSRNCGFRSSPICYFADVASSDVCSVREPSASHLQTRRSKFRHGSNRLAGSQDLAALAGQGFTEEVLGIEGRNVGRLAASITNVATTLANGVKIGQLQNLAGPDLPYRLEPQRSATWFMSAAYVRAAVGASTAVRGTDPCQVRMEVELGTGKVVETRQSMRLGSRPEKDAD